MQQNCLQYSETGLYNLEKLSQHKSFYLSSHHIARKLVEIQCSCYKEICQECVLACIGLASWVTLCCSPAKVESDLTFLSSSPAFFGQSHLRWQPRQWTDRIEMNVDAASFHSGPELVCMQPWNQNRICGCILATGGWQLFIYNRYY